jgi:hypothetical protein
MANYADYLIGIQYDGDFIECVHLIEQSLNIKFEDIRETYYSVAEYVDADAHWRMSLDNRGYVEDMEGYPFVVRFEASNMGDYFNKEKPVYEYAEEFVRPNAENLYNKLKALNKYNLIFYDYSDFYAIDTFWVANK